jgi:hypothetical protein
MPTGYIPIRKMSRVGENCRESITATPRPRRPALPKYCLGAADAVPWRPWAGAAVASRPSRPASGLRPRRAGHKEDAARSATAPGSVRCVVPQLCPDDGRAAEVCAGKRGCTSRSVKPSRKLRRFEPFTRQKVGEAPDQAVRRSGAVARGPTGSRTGRLDLTGRVAYVSASAGRRTCSTGQLGCPRRRGGRISPLA